MEPGIIGETVPTPNPAEVGFRIRISSNQLKLGWVPVIGQTYVSTLIPGKPRVDEFKEYVYSYQEKDGGNIWLYFSKAKTAAERNTPFRTIWSTRFYPWPPVLYALKIFQSYRFPNTAWTGYSTETAARYFVKYRYKPTPKASSVIRIDQYLSDIPYSGETLTHNQPIPGEINADVLGLNINFPSCLHPRTTFNQLIPGAQEISNSGTDGASSFISAGSIVFPATNFLDWASFVLEDQVNPVKGQFLREKITIFPPAEPEIVIR